MRLTSLRESPHAFSSTYESALNRTAESWSEQANSIAKGNERALRFYRKYGFTLTDRTSLDGPDDAILLKEINVEQNSSERGAARASEVNARPSIQLNFR